MARLRAKVNACYILHNIPSTGVSRYFTRAVVQYVYHNRTVGMITDSIDFPAGMCWVAVSEYHCQWTQ